MKSKNIQPTYPVATENLGIEEICSPQDIADAKARFPKHNQGQWKKAKNTAENNNLIIYTDQPERKLVCRFPGNDIEEQANADRIVRAANVLSEIESSIKTLEDNQEGLSYADAYFLANLKQLIKQADQK